jgi:hypothetical protein
MLPDMSACLAAIRLHSLALRSLPAVALLSLGACAPPPIEQWQSVADGTVANVAETSDCRAQARRQALARYPVQPIEETVRTPRLNEPARTETEGVLFRSCMRQKGFMLMVLPPGS